jgi:hypothetical protein
MRKTRWKPEIRFQVGQTPGFQVWPSIAQFSTTVSIRTVYVHSYDGQSRPCTFDMSQVDLDNEFARTSRPKSDYIYRRDCICLAALPRL